MYHLYDPANMASQSPASATNGLAVYNVALLDLGDGDVSNARGYTISPCFGATHIPSIPSHSSTAQHSTRRSPLHTTLQGHMDSNFSKRKWAYRVLRRSDRHDVSRLYLCGDSTFCYVAATTVESYFPIER
jgi:hypothetical protein